MAKRRRFKCGKCDRLFSMAAHLARHVNMTHASKTSVKRRQKKVVRRGRARVTQLTVARDAAPVIRNLRSYRAHLVARRAELDAQLSAICDALAAMKLR